jgi:hypothetical protein
MACLQGTRAGHLLMPWFAPFSVLLGILGTREGLHARHLRRGNHARGWWLIPLVAWLPLVYWVLVQFIPQA